MRKKQSVPSWHNCKDLDTARHLVDIGVVVGWRDAKHVTGFFSTEDQVTILRYMILRLCERVDIRLSQEIIVESILIWLANARNETLIVAMLQELFANEQCESACKTMLEVIFSAEYAERDHVLEIYDLSVVLICELGFAIQSFERQFPGQLKGSRHLLDRVATYLLSASNSNSEAVRLSLVHYFGETEKGLREKVFFNRVLSRFGHTVLDHLFGMLFHKKVEGVALQYLLENMPQILEADHHTQVIIHESLKFYALKHPDRFGLFLVALAERIQSQTEQESVLSRRALLLQFMALFRVASEVNARDLGRDIIIAMGHLKADPSFYQLTNDLEKDAFLRPVFKEMVQKLVHAASQNIDPGVLVMIKNVKRGRKPSLAKTGEMGTVSQVTFLAQSAS